MNIYKFVFGFVYDNRMEKEEGNIYSKYEASLVTSIAIWVHIFFGFMVYKKLYYGSQASFEKASVSLNKSLFLILFFSTQLLFFLYYDKKRLQNLMDNEKFHQFKKRGLLKVILVVFIPLILAFIVGFSIK